MRYRAKYDSWGFKGRSWQEGDITPPLTKKDLKDPAIIHFEPYDGGVEQEEEPRETLATMAQGMHLAQQERMKTGITAGYNAEGGGQA